MKNFALVYLVDDDPSDRLTDAGNDPCFDCPPSWGICRPDIRNEKEIRTGSKLLFIARVFDNSERKYFIKGYFEVKDKINIIDAYKLFQNRQNIIISTQKRNQNNKWDNEKWENYYKNSKILGIPVFLREFNWDSQIYYQKVSDNHGIDNWKCRRIFNCYLSSFIKCIERKICIKEKGVLLKKNYIHGDKDTFKDWNGYRIEWKEIAKLIGKSENLMRAHRHPEIELSASEIEIIINHMNNKSCY